jgi:sulfate permease, SulP family
MYSTRDFTSNLPGNLFGGITAAIVALPLALAFGIASGIGPAAGLYGAVSVGFFAAIFGGTPTQISGPTGPMTVVMTAMTASYLSSYPDTGLALAFSTVLLGGLLQILFGLLRIGKYIIMVPYPVISGFMTGIGVIIILLQLGPLLGHPAIGEITNALTALPAQLGNYSGQALLAGGTSLAIIFLWRGRYNRIIPSPLLALIVATLTLNVIFPDNSIATIGDIPSTLPTLQLPTFRFDILQSMLINALMLAVLGSIDSLLTSLVADNITGTQHDSDRELVGQGIGNMVAGLIGGLPGAGATMRTMVNIRAGGSGPLSGVVHAALLLSMVAGLGFLFRSIPLAALAGILIKVGIDIIDWPFIKRLHRLPSFPVVLMTTVFLLTVFVDLITAVFVGVFIKNMVTINKLSDLQLGTLVISDGVLDLERLPVEQSKVLSEHAGEPLLLRVTGPLSYAVGRGLNHRLRQKLGDNKLLLIDIADASIVGTSTAIVLEDLVRNALGKGIKVQLIGANKANHSELWQIGLIDLVRKENCLTQIDEAF